MLSSSGVKRKLISCRGSGLGPSAERRTPRAKIAPSTSTCGARHGIGTRAPATPPNRARRRRRRRRRCRRHHGVPTGSRRAANEYNPSPALAGAATPAPSCPCPESKSGGATTTGHGSAARAAAHEAPRSAFATDAAPTAALTCAPRLLELPTTGSSARFRPSAAAGLHGERARGRQWQCMGAAHWQTGIVIVLTCTYIACSAGRLSAAGRGLGARQAWPGHHDGGGRRPRHQTSTCSNGEGALEISTGSECARPRSPRPNHQQAAAASTI